jgi:hypothetical protein
MLSRIKAPNGLLHGQWASVDSAWEQKKLEARKILAVGVTSEQMMIYQDTPRFVRRFLLRQNCWLKKDDKT